MTQAKLDQANYINNKIKEIDEMLDAGGMLTIYKSNNKTSKISYPTDVNYGGIGSVILTLVKQDRLRLIKELEEL